MAHLSLLGCGGGGGAASNGLLTGLVYWLNQNTNPPTDAHGLISSFSEVGTVTSVTGKVGNANRYDNGVTSGYHVSGSAVDLGITDKFTVAWWGYFVSAPAGSGRMVDDGRLMINFQNNINLNVFVNGTSYWSRSYDVGWRSTWTHNAWVVDLDADTALLYIDGVSQGSITAQNEPHDSTVNSGSQTLYVGASTGGAFNHRESIDQLGCWNRCLPESDIQTMANDEGYPY